MITEATLYLAAPDDARGALLCVVGQPVAFRALVAAIRAGCHRVSVPAAFRGTEVERAIAASPRARAVTVWLDGEADPPSGPSLLLPAAVLVPAPDLRRILQGDAPTALLIPDAPAPVVAVPADLARTLWPEICAARPLAPALRRMLDDRMPGHRADWYVHVTTPAQARQAETLLYRTLGSVIDTPLDVAFHRRLSRPLTRIAIAMGLTPNQVSVLSLVVGLLAAWRFWRATPASAVLGLALYAFAVVLDHSDGEVARLTLAESRFGEWLDVASDTVIHAALVLAMGVTAQQAAGRGAVALGLLAAIGVVVSAMIAKTSPRSAGGGFGGFLETLGSRDAFYGMLISFILALAVAPALLPLLMIVVAAGSHAYWLGRLAYRLFAR